MPFIGNKPSAVPLTSADITDGIIVNADINASAAIASSKLSITSPLSITGNATAGSEIRLPEDTDNGSHYVSLKAADNLTANLTLTLPSADGTSGQVLQTNGSGVLSFSSPSSDFVKLATATASASSYVTFNGYFSSTYDTYKIIAYDVQHSADSKLGIQLAYSGSYTYITSNYNHMSQGGYGQFAGSYDGSWADGASGSAQWEIRFSQGNFSNSSALYEFTFANFNSTSTTYKSFIGCHNGRSVTWDIANMVSSGWCTDSTMTSNATTGIRFLSTAGTITKGKFILYGIKGI